MKIQSGVVILLFVLSGIQAGLPQTNETEEETYEAYEKKFKTNVGNIVKKLLPHLLKGGADAQISGPCTASIMKTIGAIRQLKEWAMRFLDATGKIPPGILEGTSISLGDYDECLDIEVGKRDAIPQSPEEVAFRGKYCMLENHRPHAIQRAMDEYYTGNKDVAIAKTKTFLNMLVRYKHLANSTFKIGVCIPSKCSKEDIESILNAESLRSIGKISVAYCEVKEEKKKTSEQLILLCIVGFILGCLILGTAIDGYFRLITEEKESKSDTLSYIRKIVKSTSLYNNSIKVLSTENFHEPITCLCAIRTITVMLMIYSHTYAHLHILHFQKFSKSANFIRFFDSFVFCGISNGSVGVDTICFLAAFTIAYNSCLTTPEKVKVNPAIIKTFFKRYFRLSAAQLLTIGLFLLFPVFGSGPLWRAYTDAPLDMCRKRWWLNLIYLGNFWKTTDICLYHTWILALVMQLTILGLIIVIVLKKSSRYGLLFICIVILAGMVGVGVMTVLNELPGSLAFFMLDHKTFPVAWRDVYILPYDHMGPFSIGILLGYYLAIKKDKLEISRMSSSFLWCLSIICNTAVMFGLYSYRNGAKIPVSLATIYAIMHRNVWALGVGWTIIACTTHHAGPVSRLLKAKIFVPLDRLCVMAFMLHIPIMFYHSGVLRERWYMGHLEVLFLAIAYAVMSFWCSFVVHIIFASPYYAIEEQIAYLFGAKNKIDFRSKAISPHQNTAVIILDNSSRLNGLSTS